MRKHKWVVSVLIGAVAVCVLVAMRTAVAAGSSSGAMFRVMPWPNDAPDTPYHREVEEFLNRMASEGYRFHSELSVQPARMMVFEKIAR